MSKTQKIKVGMVVQVSGRGVSEYRVKQKYENGLTEDCYDVVNLSTGLIDNIRRSNLITRKDSCFIK